jgi:rubrerythrin
MGFVEGADEMIVVTYCAGGRMRYNFICGACRADLFGFLKDEPCPVCGEVKDRVITRQVTAPAAWPQRSEDE